MDKMFRAGDILWISEFIAALLAEALAAFALVSLIEDAVGKIRERKGGKKDGGTGKENDGPREKQ